jgi:hypothetical protein
MMATKRLLRLAQIVVFAACVSTPLALVGFGQRGEPVTNRRPAPLPALGAFSLFDTDTTAAFDAYLDDLFPLVDEAVRLDATIDRRLGDSPNPDVVVAADGWLYLRESVDQNCLTPSELDTLAETLDRADRVVSSTGRTLVNVIAPDKASVFPDNLASPPACVLANADRLSELETDSTVITTWEATRAVARRDDTAYRRLDTHWSTDGAAPTAGAVVDLLEPGLWSDAAIVRSAPAESVGDLTVLMGLPEAELTQFDQSVPGPGPTVVTTITAVDRQGDAVEGVVAATYRNDWALGIRPPTVLLHDSFGPGFIKIASGYFADLSTVDEPAPNTWFTRPLVQASEVIVRLDAQRRFYDVVVGPDLAAQLAVALSDELPGRELASTCTRVCELSWSAAPQGADVYVIATLADGRPTATVSHGERRFVLDDASPWAAWFAGEGNRLDVLGDVDGVEFSVVFVP